MKTLLLNKTNIMDLISMKDAIQSVEEAYKIHHRNELIMPDIMTIDIDHYQGELDIKSCYSKANDLISVKQASGYWQNSQINLPNLLANISLLDSKTGYPLCMMEGSLITGYRTGAAGGVSCKYLSRKDAKVVAVIGSGQQARMQIRAIKCVRDIEDVNIWSPSSESMFLYKEEMEKELDIKVHLCDSVKEAVENADIVVTATPSRNILVYKQWIKKGTHIVAVGADTEGKQELDPQLFTEKVYVDSIDQCLLLGESRNALEAGYLKKSSIYAEIGSVLLGKKMARESSEEITIFDTTGMGIQDTVLAAYIYKKALNKNMDTYYDFWA